MPLLYHLFFCRGKQQQIDDLTRDNEGLRAQLTNCEKDLASLKYQIDEATKDGQALKGALSKCESDKVLLIMAAEKAETATIRSCWKKVLHLEGQIMLHF